MAQSLIKYISVLILSYNHSDFILDAIKSIEANCSDEYSLEIIILDDGSTDRTVEIVTNYCKICTVSIKLICHKHEGVHAIAKNFNKLISLATGDYLCFLASDDSYTNDRFKEQLKIMQSNEKIVIVYSDGVNIIGGHVEKKVLSSKERQILLSNESSKMVNFLVSNVPSLFIQSCMLKASFAKSFTVFDDDLIADDWVFNINVFRKIQNENLEFAFLDKVVFYRNIHRNNTSSDPIVHYKRIKQVCDRYVIEGQRLLDETLFLSIYQCMKTYKFVDIFKLISYRNFSFIDFFVFVKNSFLLIFNKVFGK